MGEGDDRVALCEQRFGGVEVDPLIGGQRAGVDFIAGELPGHDVRMMLEPRQQNAIAIPARIGARDEVDRFGRAAGEDDFIGVLSAEQFRGRRARAFIRQRHVRRALVDRAMDGGVVAGIGIVDRVDHRLRLLRSGGTVEIMPVGDRRELVADIERTVEAGLNVHAIALSAVRAAAAISAR